MTAAQRQAATQQHALAVAAMNDMFDKVDELAVAREQLTDIAPLGAHDDPIQDAEAMLAHAALLDETPVDSEPQRSPPPSTATAATSPPTSAPRAPRCSLASYPPIEPAQLTPVPRGVPTVAHAEAKFGESAAQVVSIAPVRQTVSKTLREPNE